MNDPNDQQHGFDRRTFLKGSGAVAAAGAVTLPGPGEVEAAPASEAAGPGAVPMTLSVNGRQLTTKL